MTYTNNLVEKIYDIKYENLETNTVTNVKEGLIHYLYCMFLGTDSDTYRKSFKIDKMNDSMSDTYPIFFSENGSSFFDSIFYNALIAQEILHEDIHKASNSHPGIIIFPSTLITSKYLKSSGKEFIESVIAGYETICNIGKDINREKLNVNGFRPTSILGVLGSSASVSKLLKLEKSKIENGLSLATNTASGLNSWADEGTEELFIQNGMASKNGCVSSFLAKEGIQSAKGILEREKGFFNAFGAMNVNDFSPKKDYMINDIQYKLVPACALIQSAGILGTKMKDLDFNKIDNITIETHMLGKHYPGCDFSGPFTSVIQARMSNQYLLAASMKYNSVSNNIYTNFNDNELYEVSQKIDVKVNDEFNNLFPDRQPMRAKVKFIDGKEDEFQVFDSQYVSQDQLNQNFLMLFTSEINKEIATEIVTIINKLEELESLDILFDLISKIK